MHDADADAAPAVSVVIPTYRRDELLRRCLAAVAEQRPPAGGLEIIVVDDGRSPTTAPLIDTFRAAHPGLRLTLLEGAGRGPAAARNRGWRQASAPVVAFIDDDAYPAQPGWLAAGLAHFDGSDVLAVAGAVTVPADDPPTDFQRNVKQLESSEFLTCNAFYRRSALEAVGGFDERFLVPFREDSDLQYRVEALGGRMLHEPAAVVVHPAPPGPFAVSLRLQRYSMFNALMYRKHPRLYRERLQSRPPLSYYGTLLAAALFVAGAAGGRRNLAAWSLLAWLYATSALFVRRARGASHTRRHLLDLAFTSALIPPLSVYWRIRGAVRFRVLFL